MNELVSIIMPSFNTGRFIAASIDSVISQTYTNWELLIVDDCSTDSTDFVVSRYTDKRIHYCKNSKNEGAAVCRNRALAQAKGRWVAFLDSDDLWSAEKLEKQICFMENHHYCFSYTQYREIDEKGVSTGVSISGPKRISGFGMRCYCWPGCLTVMYDRNIIGDIQIENIRKNNDYAMWLQVSRKASCYLLTESLALYRRGRSGSISTHHYGTLIRWHYRLYRQAEHQSIVVSMINTGMNLLFGVVKKIFYVRKEENND